MLDLFHVEDPNYEGWSFPERKNIKTTAWAIAFNNDSVAVTRCLCEFNKFAPYHQTTAE